MKYKKLYLESLEKIGKLEEHNSFLNGLLDESRNKEREAQNNAESVLKLAQSFLQEVAKFRYIQQIVTGSTFNLDLFIKGNELKDKENDIKRNK